MKFNTALLPLGLDINPCPSLSGMLKCTSLERSFIFGRMRIYSYWSGYQKMLLGSHPLNESTGERTENISEERYQTGRRF